MVLLHVERRQKRVVVLRRDSAQLQQRLVVELLERERSLQSSSINATVILQEQTVFLKRKKTTDELSVERRRV